MVNSVKRRERGTGPLHGLVFLLRWLEDGFYDCCHFLTGGFLSFS